jgi:hypothetical protein
VKNAEVRGGSASRHEVRLIKAILSIIFKTFSYIWLYMRNLHRVRLGQSRSERKCFDNLKKNVGNDNLRSIPFIPFISATTIFVQFRFISSHFNARQLTKVPQLCTLIFTTKTPSGIAVFWRNVPCLKSSRTSWKSWRKKLDSQKYNKQHSER